VVLDGSQADALDQATGDLHSAGFAQTGGTDRNGSASMFGIGNATASQVRLGDSGGASRFFPTFREDDPGSGRWPPNVALDESQADALDQATGTLTTHGGGDRRGVSQMFGLGADGDRRDGFAGDSGGPSRFFPTFRYQAKAPTSERPTYTTPDGRKISHPTVKPLGLMRWLVRLVTPPGGTVLDPFAGSGATVEACLIEGFDCIAIERDPESLPLIQIRIDRQAGTLPFEDVS
jgi:hypothetical protein